MSFFKTFQSIFTYEPRPELVNALLKGLHPNRETRKLDSLTPGTIIKNARTHLYEMSPEETAKTAKDLVHTLNYLEKNNFIVRNVFAPAAPDQFLLSNKGINKLKRIGHFPKQDYEVSR